MTKRNNNLPSGALRAKILTSASTVALSAFLLSPTAIAAETATSNDAPVATGGNAVLMAQVIAQPNRAGSLAAGESKKDEVVVKGIRSSLENAVQIKRNADNVVDSISAESMGRFPDLNLAESMQRISGVNIIRDDFRGGKIAIRGISGFTKTQVNGQDLASPTFGGGFVFGMFESSVMAGVDVHKTPMVSMDDGGIAGVVNLKTRKALSFDDDRHFFINVKGQYEQLAGKLVPDIGASAGFKNDAGTFGAYITAGYQARDFRSDSVKIKEYKVFDPAGKELKQSDLLADPSLKSTATYVPFRASYTSRKTTGDRISIAGGAEWAPTDDLSISLTGLYGESDSRQPLNNISFMTFGTRPFHYTVLETQDDGEFGKTATRIRVEDPQMQVQERIRDQYFKTFAGTLDADWSKDLWDVHGAIHYTKGETRQTQFQVASRIDNQVRDRPGWGNKFVPNGLVYEINTGSGNPYGAAFTLNQSPGDVGTFGYSRTNTADVWDQYYAALFASGHANNNERAETQFAAQLDFSREMDVSLIKSIDFGAKFKSEKHDNFQKGFGDVFNQWGGRDLSHLDDSFFKTGFNTEGAGFFSGDVAFQGLLVPDSEKVLASLTPVDASTLSDTQRIDPLTGLVYTTTFGSNFNNSQEIMAFYAQANIEEEIPSLGINLRGNFGFRYVDTARVSKSKIPTLINGKIEKVEFEEVKHLKNFLPQFNLIADITDDIVMRGSYSRTMAPPNPFTLSAGNSVTETHASNDPTSPLTKITQGFDKSQLEPFEADSYDIVAEWYNRPGSSFHIGAFAKVISNAYVEHVDCPASIPGITSITGTPSFDANGKCFDEAGVEISSRRLFNSKDETYTVKGLEAGLTQNFDFLDGWASNFGVTANYTYLTSSNTLSDKIIKNLANPTDPLVKNTQKDSFRNLFSLSPHSFNLIGYYETDQFGLRIAGNYRHHFDDNNALGGFLGSNRVVDNRLQWDMSGSYNINDSMKLGFEVVNVFDKDRYEYQAVKGRFRNLFTEGRTVTMSASYIFH